MIFYGRNVTLEALRSSLAQRASFLLLQEGISVDEKISEIRDRTAANNIDIRYHTRQEISKLVNSEEHQGVAIDIPYTQQKLAQTMKQQNDMLQAYMYISTATYEHNIGAIIRSAEVAGLSGVIIPKEAAITPTVARTSAGALFHIPVFKESLFNTIKLFQKQHIPVYAIERDGTYYADQDLTGDGLFIIGGEDKSISPQVAQKCDAILTIEQRGKVNSLNMSVAASIVLFERMRQIKKMTS